MKKTVFVCLWILIWIQLVVQDKRVNWHSTPFETRLERALNGDAAADASTHVPSIF